MIVSLESGRKMAFKAILISSISASFEIKNKSCYYSSHQYDVYLNNQLYYKDMNLNVFSLFNLYPNTNYEIKVVFSQKEVIKTITTLEESAFINVKRFGALGDGVHDDTLAIQTAIMAVPKNGRIVFEKGTYLTKPLLLRDNITLELKKDATILGNPHREHYSILPGLIDATDEVHEYHLNAWEGNPLETFTSLITGINVSNVNIIGEGVIDGNAQNSDWWVNHKVKRISWRPRLMFFNRCKNITIHGIKVKNSPAWNIHPFYSENINLIDIKIKNPMDSPNTDGIDPESCDGVNIIGTKISVGDDCVVLKSGKLYLGTYFLKPIENVAIRNCLMEKGHGAVVLGSEISSGAKNIRVTQCLFKETDRGLRVKTRRGRGKNSIIDHITFENILMNGVKTPLTMNMHYRCDPDGDSYYVYTEDHLEVDDWTPYLGNFIFKNIRCENVHYAATYFVGLPEQKIKSITMENISFHYHENARKGVAVMKTYIEPTCKLGAYFNRVENVTLKNVIFDGNCGDEIILEDVCKMKRDDS